MVHSLPRSSPAATGISGRPPGQTGETRPGATGAQKGVPKCFETARVSDPQRSPITLVGARRKYCSEGVCALAATLIKKAAARKTGIYSPVSVKMEIITDVYGG
jgi:hypothetical protein